MAEVPDNLAPQDRLSNFHVELAGVFPIEQHGAADFAFDIVNVETEAKVGTLRFTVEAEADGLHGMYGRAHQQVIDAFRQMIWRAEVQRKAYCESAPASASPSGTR